MLERALDILFILHADHEQNCSTIAMRSSRQLAGRPRISSMAGAAAALSGPLHGGANEAVLRMLAEIGSLNNVPAFIKRVKAGDGRLMGFGHRVYKSYDPRATIIKRIGRRGVRGHRARTRCSRSRSSSSASRSRTSTSSSGKLYPNVDFYSGLIYQAMGFPTDMFPVLFAIPRTAGWLAQWEESCSIPTRRSRGRARSTSAPTCATTCRWRKRR